MWFGIAYATFPRLMEVSSSQSDRAGGSDNAENVSLCLLTKLFRIYTENEEISV